MELIFKPPTRAQSLLNLDASLAQWPRETTSALLCAIRDATLAISLEDEHRSFLSGCLKALQVQETCFRSVLRKFTLNWVPTYKEEEIIQAAHHGFYQVGDIEGAFYQYGGLYGIVALVIVFRETDSILKQWEVIDDALARQWLVNNVSQLFSSQQNIWMSNFIPQKPRRPSTLRYLGKHVNRRQSPGKYRQPQERHDGERSGCLQLPAPTSIPSPPDQGRLDNKRPKCDQRSFQFKHGLLSPISTTFPPFQGLPEQLLEHHYERARSTIQQCIATPTSNASPLGLDPVNPGHRWSPTPISLEQLKNNDTHARVEAVESTPDNGLVITLSNSISQGTPHDAGLHRTLATTISGEQSLEPVQVAPALQESTVSRKIFVFEHPRVSQSPSPPQALLVSEALFHYIRVYFQDTCQKMMFDDHGTLLAPNGKNLRNDLCNDFDSYCFTATMLNEKGLHVEFRCALSKALAPIEQILRAEHPRTLACFLEVFIHLIQTGLPDVTLILRRFIKRMSAKVTRKGHPWGQICRLLDELDPASLDQAMAQAWECITDTFDSELGAFSRLAVSVRLDYIKRVCGITNYLEEERLLRTLLAQIGGVPGLSTPRVMLNLAHNLNRQGRHGEAGKMAQEVLSLLQKSEMYAGRIVERIESLKIVSRSQFNQGKTLAAEQTMRQAIGMIIDQWGPQHSWVPEFVNFLEGWLRGWGREDDANALRREIEALLGKDESDEQHDLLC